MNDQCPNCKSYNTVSISSPSYSLGECEHSVESLAHCKTCKDEFVVLYIETKTIPINESTKYS